MKPDICIYHADCDDGFAAAYAVWERWGDDVRYIPAQYGQEPPDVTGKDVLMVDFSYKADVLEEMTAAAQRIVILDHHKTAESELKNFTQVEVVDGPVLKRYFDRLLSGTFVHFNMEKSGCRLAWEYCHGSDLEEVMPDWMDCIEDRDLWRFKLEITKEICAAIRSYPRDFRTWDRFSTRLLLTEGVAIRRYIEQIVSNISKTAFTETIAGHEVPVAACSYDFVSETAHKLLMDNPDAPFAACIVRSYDGVTYSLRSADDRMDVSEIAKSMGGGGHRNAAGYRVDLEGAKAA